MGTRLSQKTGIGLKANAPSRAPKRLPLVGGAERCVWCEGSDIVKRGIRVKKHERVQVYFCNHCKRKFVPQLTRFKTYPLRVVLDALTHYNRLHTFKEAARRAKDCYGITLTERTISDWLKIYAEHLPFLRMREFISGKYTPREAIEELRLFHGQIYDFRYHRAKLECILGEEFRNQKFKPLKDFLELVLAECPHQIFRESNVRSSEQKNLFNLDRVKIIPKVNAAVKTANFVLQAVANNKLRHDVLQRFMLANDSVTVATEVPVLLDPDDVRHFTHELRFDVPLALDRPLTGHIDFIQVRNGMIHILDYKPSAEKAKPIEQLTLYALALSRLTTIRLFHMKCAWFDKNHYYEFFPLHVVYKKQNSRRHGVKF